MLPTCKTCYRRYGESPYLHRLKLLDNAIRPKFACGPRREKSCLRGFQPRSCSNQPAQLQRLVSMLKLYESSLKSMPCGERKVKALIRLCGCAGWSASMLSARDKVICFSIIYFSSIFLCFNNLVWEMY